MKLLIRQEEPCTSLNTIQIGEEGGQKSEEVDSVGDTSVINTISVSNHFISYSYYANLCCHETWPSLLKKKNHSNYL